ncbi:MAG: hypothetical protein C4290_15135 [Chloroflexota bacterium]
MPAIACPGWRDVTRARAVEAFRLAWERAPVAGRAALLDAAARDAVGHRWETGRHACVLALLVAPALKPGEPVKAGAYRLFGWEVTEDFPATWDAGGVTLAELLAAVGVRLPERAGRRVGLTARPVGTAAD